MVLDTNKEFLYNEFKGFESDYRDVLINLVDNLTSTSTNGSYIKETSYKTKGKKVSGDLISSSFASSSLGSNLLTITKSTQFVASCYFDPTNSTSTIIKNVYVVGGGER